MSDVRQAVLFDGSLGPREVAGLQKAIAHDQAGFRSLRDAVAEFEERESPCPACFVRVGVYLDLLGRYDAAIGGLRRGDGGALAHFHLAKAYAARQCFGESIQSLKAAR